MGTHVGRSSDITRARCFSMGASGIGGSTGFITWKKDWSNSERGKVEAGGVLFPRPEIEFGPLRDDSRLTLEIYPSLRRPYTSLIFDHTVRLAEKTPPRINIRLHSKTGRLEDLHPPWDRSDWPAH